MKFSELTECQFCGCNEFYVKEYYFGSLEFILTFDGTEGDNSGMYDGLSVKTNKRTYCRKCNKYLGNYYADIVGREAEQVLKECENNG